MIDFQWGLLGPATLAGMRRTRTLGVGGAVRRFNHLAVPGTGGVWFGMQLVLATLGVAVAEKARGRGVRVQNVEAANAIEALGCWFAFGKNNWGRDSRLRGVNKLRGRGEDLSFSRVRQRNFYVSQPMRMATVQALPALGFVEADGGRFNGFRLSVEGETVVKAACDGFEPGGTGVVEYLANWIQHPSSQPSSGRLKEALSPARTLSRMTRELLRERILQGRGGSDPEAERRRNAFRWVEAVGASGGNGGGWDRKPGVLAADHWEDLRAGALLFAARDAAVGVLDALERQMSEQGSGTGFALGGRTPEAVSEWLEGLRAAARKYLDTGHRDGEAREFCTECLQPDAAVLRCLGGRDERVIRVAGDELRPGPAFRRDPEAAGPEEGAAPPVLALPEGISYRVPNLYLLNLDLRGELDGWLAGNAGEVIR